jgi:hypothetical protein
MCSRRWRLSSPSQLSFRSAPIRDGALPLVPQGLEDGAGQRSCRPGFVRRRWRFRRRSRPARHYRQIKRQPRLSDETQFAEFVRGKAHARSGRADHLHRCFLTKLSHDRLRPIFLAEVCRAHKRKRPGALLKFNQPVPQAATLAGLTSPGACWNLRSGSTEASSPPESRARGRRAGARSPGSRP